MNDVRPSSRRATVVAVAILIATALAPWGRAQTPSAAPQAAAPPAATAAKRAFEPADWYKLKTVAAPAMSPDGKYVAVQVTSVVEAKNARMSEIWVVATAPDGGAPVRFSAPGFDSTAPRFSPDSTHVIYTSTRPGYSTTQWAARVDRPGGESPYTAAAEGPGRGGYERRRILGTPGRPGAGAGVEPAGRQEFHRLHRRRERRRESRRRRPRPRQRLERSLREDAADGQTAGERGHAAARSGAVRRHADHRHALQGQRPRLRPEHRRAGRPRRRSRPRRPRACRGPAADADSRRSPRRRRAQGDHELDLLAPRRDRVARRQVDRLRRRRRSPSRSRTAQGSRRDRQARDRRGAHCRDARADAGGSLRDARRPAARRGASGRPATRAASPGRRTRASLPSRRTTGSAPTPTSSPPTSRP